MRETINRPVCLSGPSYFKELLDQELVQIGGFMVREDPTVKHNTELVLAARGRNDKKSNDIDGQMSGAIAPSVRCSGGHALSNAHKFDGYVCRFQRQRKSGGCMLRPSIHTIVAPRSMQSLFFVPRNRFPHVPTTNLDLL